jgi:Tfp pilus assembly protein FimT
VRIYHFLKNRADGFLLIEALIIIALITLTVTLGVSFGTSLHKTIVRSEVERLYAACMYLQRLAMLTNKRQLLTFDVNKNAYFYQGHEERLSSYVTFGILRDIKGPPSAPTTVINKPITFTNNQIIFTPNGILQSGTVYLTDISKQHQYALTAPISQISFLRKYRYDNKWNYFS